VYFSVSFGFVCWYVSQVIGWEDLLSWYLSWLQSSDWRVIYCSGLFCVFPTWNV